MVFNNETIALSLTGIPYNKYQLQKYSQVLCSYCGKSIIINEEQSSRIKLSLHVKCQPKMKRFRDKINQRNNKKTKEEIMNQKMKNSENTKKRRKANKLIVFQHYSNGFVKCDCCGEPDERFLTVEHENNDGAKHRKTIGDIYAWLIRNKFPKGFRILCFNCNCAKGIYGECPHILESPERKIIDDEALIIKGRY